MCSQPARTRPGRVDAAAPHAQTVDLDSARASAYRVIINAPRRLASCASAEVAFTKNLYRGQILDGRPHLQFFPQTTSTTHVYTWILSFFEQQAPGSSSWQVWVVLSFAPSGKQLTAGKASSSSAAVLSSLHLAISAASTISVGLSWASSLLSAPQSVGLEVIFDF